MNKITIPVILAAIVLVSGIFAFSSVEEASTVHTTLLSAGVSCTASTASTVGAAGDEVWTIDNDGGGGFLMTALSYTSTGADNAGDGLEVDAGDLTWDSGRNAIPDIIVGALDETDNLLTSNVPSSGTALTFTVAETHSGTDFTYVVTVCGITEDGGAMTITE